MIRPMMKRLRYWLLLVLTCLFTIYAVPGLSWVEQPPSSPSPFSQAWEKGSQFKVPLPKLGEGFRERASHVESLRNLQAMTPTDLHAQGQTYFDQGQFAQAAQAWQAAIAQFNSQDNTRAQALTEGHLAIAHQELGQWTEAQAALDRAWALAEGVNDTFVQAQLWMSDGEYKLHMGATREALASWQQAESNYQRLKDDLGILRSRLNQAQALQVLGQYRQSLRLLEESSQQLGTGAERSVNAATDGHAGAETQVLGLQALGTTLTAVGQWPLAEAKLQEGLAIAQQNRFPTLQASLLLNLGNLKKAMGETEVAIQFYQQAAEADTDSPTSLTARLNAVGLWVRQGKSDRVASLLPEMQQQLNQTPSSRETVYGRVNLAESLLQLNPRGYQLNAITQLLDQALQEARQLKDVRGEAYALGQLGHVYEYSRRWREALVLTERAVQLAQSIQAQDVAMPWLWQEGRILLAQGQRQGAIAAYGATLETLQDLRQDLVALSPDVQFSFREQVEPVYRQFVKLLLADVDGLPSKQREERLQRSRQIIEGLQLATLDNFFRQACIVGTPKRIDNIDAQAAVIYPIVVEDRLEVVLSLPGQLLQHYGRALDTQEANQVFTDIQAALTPLYEREEILPAAQTLYRWLIEPAEAMLEQQQIQTLVFVPDGFLRNIPMAVLHDGERFLVEKYNTAFAPGLQLLPLASESSAKLKVLTSGISERRQGFTALPNVETEIQQVEALLPSQKLLNQQFTQSNLQSTVDDNQFSAVHFATHGQFSSNLDDTFLLTWDDRLTIGDLDALLVRQNLRNPIDLLVLSACQTARGDDRAALGLAGVAVRAGARSTLASLWSVADDSTAQLVSEFYRRLIENGETKADALRQAQLSLLRSEEYGHPYYWAPFVMVGNWR